MRSKQIFNALFFALLYVGMQAQEASPARIREYGLGFSSLTNYSLQYRWGTEKKLLRVTGNINSNSSFGKQEYTYGPVKSGTVQNSTSSKLDAPLGVNGGLGFSVLNLKSIGEKFGLLCGPSIFLTGGYDKKVPFQTQYYTDANGTLQAINGSSSFVRGSVYLGAALGIFYKFHENFVAYAEITPSVFFEHAEYSTQSEYWGYNGNSNELYKNTNVSKTNSVGFSGLSNSSAMITLAYRMKR